MLPANDLEFLNERQLNHTVQPHASMICVILPGWKVPDGYKQSETDLLLRLSPGYPDVPPDMWWCNPGLVLLNGTAPEATQAVESYFGRSWQRWSRHFPQPNHWNSVTDGLESYLARVRAEMVKSARRAA